MEKRILVLSGAGVSLESELRTFRDNEGLWENHHVEDVARAATSGLQHIATFPPFRACE